MGEVCEIKTGNKDTKDKISNGTYPFFVRSNTVERINSYSFDGEAILTSGDGVGVGKNFHYINGKFDFHQRVYSLRNFKKEFSGKFVFNVFSDRFYKRVIKLSAKNSVDSVRMDMISKMKIYFPILEEQKKIASFFTLINSRIETQNKIIEDYKLFKKGLIQKIFNQEIRFKDENGNEFSKWEKKRVIDVFKVTRGNVLAVNNMKQVPDKEYCFPVYSSQTKNNGLTGYYRESLYENAITWTTDGANAGDVKYRKGKFYCTNVCGVLISDEGYANECVAELLNFVTRRYVSYVGNPKLMNNTMGEIKIIFPSIKEQQKIASTLSAIDDKITLETNYLEKLKSQKKYLLQNLFK